MKPQITCWNEHRDATEAEAQELSNPPVRNGRHSMEFLIGQHSLFFAGLGQSFFYLHQFKPWLPTPVATPLLLVPWGIVFVLFYRDPSPIFFPPITIRRWWRGAAGVCAGLTLIAEAIWALGLMPPPTPEHRLAADVFVQILMNFVWLAFIPMVRDYKNHPQLWP